MYFKYGDYQHADNEVELSAFSTRTIRNARGAIERFVRTLTIRGVLKADTQADIKTAVGNLEAAYVSGAGDAALYHDDDTISHHALDASETMAGVIVNDIRWLPGNGEYATGRSYEISLEAHYRAVLATGTIIQHAETITFRGSGGPRKVMVDTMTGVPIEQTVNSFTPVRATQTGSSVGWRGYPTIPAALYPSNVTHDTGYQYGAPTAVEGQYLYYPVSWTYNMQFATAPTPASPVPR